MNMFVRVALIGAALIILSPVTILVRKVIGLKNIPKSGPCIIIANHPTQYDPFLVYVSVMISTGRHIRFVTASKLYQNPIRRIIFYMAYCIKVSQPKRRTIIEASKVIAKGNMIGIFPEGGLSHKNHYVKTGFLRLAYETNAPILPVKFTSIPGIEWKGIIPKLKVADMIIGTPFYVKKPNKITRTGLRTESEKLFKKIEQLK